MSGWKAEWLVDGEWEQNAVVWPDQESAHAEAYGRYVAWTLTTDFRTVEVDEEPTRPAGGGLSKTA